LKKENNTSTCPAKRTSIGGQALIEGIMMRGPKISAMAVRNPDGEIVLEKWENEISKRPKILKWPFVRGLFNFIDSMRAGYKALMRSAEIAGLEEVEAPAEQAESQQESSDAQDTPVKAKKEEQGTPWYFNVLMVISALLGVVVAIVLFLYLPSQLYTWLTLAVPSLDGQYLVRAVFEASVSSAKALEKHCPTLVLGYIKANGETMIFSGDLSEINVSLEAEDKIIVYTDFV
jgi:uncharacterized protein YqhQ